MKKINRTQARQRYELGLPFIMISSKCPPDSPLACPIFPKELYYDDKNFNALCNEFKYYNCGSGERIHFYINETEG